jgi:AraC-like DNA-binding protein
MLLEKSGLSVTEVALAVGFSSSSYFGRVFRQEVGLSPSAYQRGERLPPD